MSGAVTYTTGADFYEEAPPPGINFQAYPYLYNVDGRYYGHRNNRWYRYRDRPRDLDERYYHHGGGGTKSTSTSTTDQGSGCAKKKSIMVSVALMSAEHLPTIGSATPPGHWCPP